MVTLTKSQESLILLFQGFMSPKLCVESKAFTTMLTTTITFITNYMCLHIGLHIMLIFVLICRVITTEPHPLLVLFYMYSQVTNVFLIFYHIFSSCRGEYQSFCVLFYAAASDCQMGSTIHKSYTQILNPCACRHVYPILLMSQILSNNCHRIVCHDHPNGVH